MKMLRVLDSSGDRAISFDNSHESAGAQVAAQELIERLFRHSYETNGRTTAL